MEQELPIRQTAGERAVELEAAVADVLELLALAVLADVLGDEDSQES
jgi:hypothetical protein